jgi:hypothetical protein
MLVDMAWGYLLTKIGVLPEQQTTQQAGSEEGW